MKQTIKATYNVIKEFVDYFSFVLKIVGAFLVTMVVSYSLGTFAYFTSDRSTDYDWLVATQHGFGGLFATALVLGCVFGLYRVAKFFVMAVREERELLNKKDKEE